MTEQAPEVAGPLCDICGQETAAASVMFLADYSQVKFGMGCAPQFLRAQADAVDQAVAAAVQQEAVPAAPLEPLPDHDAGQLPPKWSESDAAGRTHSSRPDPLTENVVKSTHGHRRTGQQETAGAAGSDGKSG